VNVGDRWASAFTAAGYAFVGIAHAGRDQASREQMCTHFGVPLTIECAQVKYLHWDRPNDLREVLDYLEAQAVGPLAGMADLDQVLYAGHSAGSGGVSLVGGASRSIYGGVRTAPDPRPKALIGCSMEGEGDDGFTADSFRPIARPHLTLSGVGDTTPEAAAPPRRVPFEVMMPGDKFRFWNTELAARHSTFNHEVDACQNFQSGNGGDPARCDEYLTWLESAALAFADAHLRDLPAAHAWLASDNLATLTGNVVEWDRR
jgi:predicted dienelactone hydrolase